METSTKKTSPKANTEKCVFCGIGKGYEDVNGQLLRKAGVTAHYFCMLFSSGLCQNGATEKEGVLGFLPEDITKEVRRGSKLKCSYCKKPGATVGCVTKNCKKTFHLGCGREHGSFHLFHDTFSSYCSAHRIQQDVPAEDDPNIVCSICMNLVKAAPCNESLRAPCCRKYWYHRDCIQQYSKSAGLYFFKCPMCNNKEDFQKEMLAFGIYIPDQDAAWESEPNAYQELLERYQHCDALVCKCLEGRSYDKEGSKWEILLCNICGSQGSHEGCRYLIKDKGRQICPECYEIHHGGKGKESNKKTESPSKSSFEQLQQKCATSPVQTKNASSEYPGPSGTLPKRKIPSKFNSPKKSKKAKHESAKKRLTVSNQVISLKKKTSGSPLESAKRKSQLGSSKCDNGKNDRTKTTFMERYLNSFVLSSSPSSSSTDSSVEEYLPTSYLKSSQIVSAFELKKAKRKRKKKEKESHEHDIVVIGSDDEQQGKKKKMPVSNSALGPAGNSGLNLVHVSGESKKDTKPQKTLDSWLKWTSPKVVMSPKQETQSIKQSHINCSKSPQAQPGKRIVIDWQGKQLVIQSPKVFLNKQLLRKKFRPKKLEIDMVDERGNKGWENELAVLSNIDPGVRVTRNMVSSNTLSDLVSSSGQNTKGKRRKRNRANLSEEERVDDGNNSAKIKSSLFVDSESVSLTHAAAKKPGESLNVAEHSSETVTCVPKLGNRSHREAFENESSCTDTLIDKTEMCAATKLSESCENSCHTADEDISNKSVCIVDASPMKKQNSLFNSDQVELEKSIAKNTRCRKRSLTVLDDSPTAKLLISTTYNEGKPRLSLSLEKKKIYPLNNEPIEIYGYSEKTSCTTDNPHNKDCFACDTLSKEPNNNIELETKHCHKNSSDLMKRERMNEATVIEIDSSPEKVDVIKENVSTEMDFPENFGNIKGYRNNKRKVSTDLSSFIPKRFKHRGCEIGQSSMEKLENHQSNFGENSPETSCFRVASETYPNNLVQDDSKFTYGQDSDILKVTETPGESDLASLNLGKGSPQRRKLANPIISNSLNVNDFSQNSFNESVGASTTSSPQHVRSRILDSPSRNARSLSLQTQHNGDMRNMPPKQNMTISSLSCEFQDTPSGYLINPIVEKPWKLDSPSKSVKTSYPDTQHKAILRTASPVKNSPISCDFSKPQDALFLNQSSEKAIKITVSQKMKGSSSPKVVTPIKNVSPARNTRSMSGQKQKGKRQRSVSANAFNPKISVVYDSVLEKLDSPSRNTRSSNQQKPIESDMETETQKENFFKSNYSKSRRLSTQDKCLTSPPEVGIVTEDSPSPIFPRRSSVSESKNARNITDKTQMGFTPKNALTLNSSSDNDISTNGCVRNRSEDFVCTENKSAPLKARMESPSKNTSSSPQKPSNVNTLNECPVQNASASEDVSLSRDSHSMLNSDANTSETRIREETTSRVNPVVRALEMDSPSRNTRSAVLKGEHNIDVDSSYRKLTTDTESRQQVNAQNTSSASEGARISIELDSPSRNTRTAVLQKENSSMNKNMSLQQNVSLGSKNARKSVLAKGTTKMMLGNNSPVQASIPSCADFKDKKDASQYDSELDMSMTQIKVCPGTARRSLELDMPSENTTDTSPHMSSTEKERTALQEVQSTSVNSKSNSLVRKEHQRATRNSLLSSADKKKHDVESSLNASELEGKKTDENSGPRSSILATVKNYILSKMVRNDSSCDDCETVNEQDQCKQILKPTSEETRHGKQAEKLTSVLSKTAQTARMDSNFRTSAAKGPIAARQNSSDKSVMAAYYFDEKVSNRRETTKVDS